MRIYLGRARAVPRHSCTRVVFHARRPNKRIGTRPFPSPTFADHNPAAVLVPAENVPYLVQRRRI